MCVAEALKGHRHAFADAPSRIRSIFSERFEDAAIPLRKKSPSPTAPHTAKNSPCVLAGNLSASNVKKC